MTAWNITHTAWNMSVQKFAKSVNNGDIDLTNGILCDFIMFSQYDKASIILSNLTKYRRVIMESTALDRDCTTVILEYFGNVQTQIIDAWSKMCQLGWNNSMSDLRLLQLLIFHGNRNVVNIRSPSPGENCFVSAISNNCQLMIKIILCVYRKELGEYIYDFIINDLGHTLKSRLDRIKNTKQKQEMYEIFEQYHHEFDKLQWNFLSKVLSDRFGKFQTLQSYIQERPKLFPIINDVEFQKEVDRMTMESEEKVRQHIARLKAEKEAPNLQQQEQKANCTDSTLFDQFKATCLIQ